MMPWYLLGAFRFLQKHLRRKIIVVDSVVDCKLLTIFLYISLLQVYNSSKVILKSHLIIIMWILIGTYLVFLTKVTIERELFSIDH